MLADKLKFIHTSSGIRWSEELADEVRKLIDLQIQKSIHDVELTEEEEVNYKACMRIFSIYDCSPEMFASWEDYERFVTTFAPDFFGFE